MMLIPKSSHSRRWSTVPPSSNSASNIRELLPFFSPSTYEQYLQQKFLQGKDMLKYPSWLVTWCASMWTTEMHSMFVGRWCPTDIFLRFFCAGSPPPAVSRAFEYILHQPKSSKYAFTNVCKDWQPTKMMKHLNIHGIFVLSSKSFWDRCHSPVLVL